MPARASRPALVAFSSPLAKSLGLDEAFCQSTAFVEAFVGNTLLPGMAPYACCYGGHQFGNWAGQLGDGRAMNLGELKDLEGVDQYFQLKGAGPTPYSRHADGLAVLRSSIREFLCSEAMFHLGVPTTRALALVTTGNQVERDMFYNGNPAFEPGAVVTRVAPSFIRFGSFEIFAARGDIATLESMLEYTLTYDMPEYADAYRRDKVGAILAWFEDVCSRTCDMIVHWMRTGFVHGVMNTDNMSVMGLTIDYGPYGWLDNFDPSWTPNTTDAQHRRYRYEAQPSIAQWNLLQLANALFSVVNNSSALEDIIRGFASTYDAKWQTMMASKLGFLVHQTGDEALYQELEALLYKSDVDMTLFYRALANVDTHQSYDHAAVEHWLAQLSYLDTVEPGLIERWVSWMETYCARVNSRSNRDRKAAMDLVNPSFILRNYLSQTAIEKAYEGDYSMVESLLKRLQTPYLECDDMADYCAKRPEWAKQKAGCSMLSCSS